jgi:hypothetical protein
MGRGACGTGAGSPTEQRIRELVEQGGGRAPVEEVVQRALGVAGAGGALAHRLVEVAVRPIAGLVVRGDEVVSIAVPLQQARAVAMAVASTPSPALLPSAVAWVDLLPENATPRVESLRGEGWREVAARMARDLEGCWVMALSAASVRRILRLGSVAAALDPEQEPRVVALGRVARMLGRPVSSAADAADLVGAVAPGTPEEAATQLAQLARLFCELSRRPPAELEMVSEGEVVPDVDFGGRSFGRHELLALPEAPGVYLFEDAEGDVAYVGKADNLRRRVSSYFTPRADERAARVREAAFGLAIERTGSELSALLREREFIAELQPTLNVQENVHARRRRPPDACVKTCDRLGVLQASAEGGAEVIVVDRLRGAVQVTVVVDEDEGPAVAALASALSELDGRPVRMRGQDPDYEIAMTWLADCSRAVSVVDAGGDVDAAARLLLRVARDPDLEEYRIIPVP